MQRQLVLTTPRRRRRLMPHDAEGIGSDLSGAVNGVFIAAAAWHQRDALSQR
jgi:hypothetical protein